MITHLSHSNKWQCQSVIQLSKISRIGGKLAVWSTLFYCIYFV